MPSAYELAQSMTGSREGDAAIADYLKTGGANLDPATTAWCAAFVNASLGQAGQAGTGSNMARSFLNYGTAVDQPQPGDIAVFSRGDPNGQLGHVGFYQGVDPVTGQIQVLGGNQSDQVKVSGYDKSTLLGYRRPGGGGGGVAGTMADAVDPRAATMAAISDNPWKSITDTAPRRGGLVGEGSAGGGLSTVPEADPGIPPLETASARLTPDALAAQAPANAPSVQLGQLGQLFKVKPFGGAAGQALPAMAAGGRRV